MRKIGAGYKHNYVVAASCIKKLKNDSNIKQCKTINKKRDI
jgi:hypothetical protein